MSENQLSKKHQEILDSLYKINFDSKETKETLDFIEKRKIIDISNTPSSVKEKEKDIKFFSEINKYYNPSNILNLFENCLFKDMKSITNNYKNDYDKINEILLQEKIIQEEYDKIMNEMANNEEILQTVFNFYSQYLKENKNFLIKNEILKNFLDKILLTKEERDSLTSKKEEKINLKIINKIEQVKNNIDIIQQNSTNFSKTLLQSIKKHYNVIDEMLSEKIVIYLKNFFKKFNEKILELKDFKELKILIKFLHNKEQYINFVLKEYIIMRKKFCESIIKDKYLILSSKNIDSVYTYLNEDFMFYFMKEFILICFFFIPMEFNIISIEDAYEFFVYNGKSNLLSVNDKENNKKLFNKLENILSNLGKNKDKFLSFEKYIKNLNDILYIFDTLFFEYTQKKELEFHQVYKFTLLSYYFCEKLDIILNETELVNKNKALNSAFLTNKNNFSSILRSYENEELKQLNKMKSNMINYLKDIQILMAENEINLKMNKLINNYKIIFELYEQYKPQKEENNNDIINPNQHELYLYLLDFFDNNEQIENETNLEILFKIINLLHLLNTNFKSEKNIRLFKSIIDKTISLILNNVLSEVKYEQILLEKRSHTETINMIEDLVDKIQLNLVNINYIQDFNIKESLKEKIKEQIKEIYQKKLIESKNSLNITEEELKNYLDII